MNRIAKYYGGKQDCEDLFVTALATKDERYVLIYVAEQRAEALRTLGRWASSSELSFTWNHAAMTTKAPKDQGKPSPPPPPPPKRFEPKPVLRVLTVRVPESVHRALWILAHEERTSVNQLCLSRLEQAIRENPVAARVYQQGEKP